PTAAPDVASVASNPEAASVAAVPEAVSEEIADGDATEAYATAEPAAADQAVADPADPAVADPADPAVTDLILWWRLPEPGLGDASWSPRSQQCPQSPARPFA